MEHNSNELVDKARLVAAAIRALECDVLPKSKREPVRKALVRDAERQASERQALRPADRYREIADNYTISCAAGQAHRFALVPDWDQTISDDINRAGNAKRRADRERAAARARTADRTRGIAQER